MCQYANWLRYVWRSDLGIAHYVLVIYILSH